MPVFIDDHGVRIHYIVREAENPRAIVQLVHGVGEHVGRYGALIDALVADGFSVWADDHRGHGQTGFEQHGGDLTKMGRPGPGGMRAAIDAVDRFTTVIRDENPDLPIVLVGHSWGSFIAQILLNRHPLAYSAVVLSGTAYRMPGSLDSGDLNRKYKTLGTTGAEWLSRDPAVAEAFVADPYTTLTPLAKLFGIGGALALLGRPARDLPDVPVLIMVGDDDTVGGEASALKLVRSFESRSHLTDVTLIVYADARHEIFNETNQAEVRADLLAWLDARVPSRG
ncbi:alpha/beta fold hydrolase [Agromyces atrinae]|uniref:Alpha-beta hydrolase superfamily lysophospholipase n=1 Tax=Agromyces atrinae TaxID=592376 RepID=A0A4V1R2T5_9MICO|nr:alpha/beta fold hydrolase [Agromyces atrinae]NYD67505.1 alpha-beta hydrolase superfamily lysophospholipase [Agromyces atrinae]RXZ88276.1 alpha/beta fold hydrolase [Agromyces atrinae]